MKEAILFSRKSDLSIKKVKSSRSFAKFLSLGRALPHPLISPQSHSRYRARAQGSFRQSSAPTLWFHQKAGPKN